MPRYIDAAELLSKLPDDLPYKASVKRVLAQAPIADVAEVVRCCECGHRGTYECPMYYEEDVEWDDDGYPESDTIIHDRTDDDRFCSCGERKSEIEEVQI